MKRLIKLAVWIILILIVISQIPQFKHSKLTSPFIKPGFIVKDELREAVENSLKDNKGRFGIFIKNLKTNQSYMLNEHQVFQPGSLYKIWLMAAVFEKIKSGDLKEDDILSNEVSNLNRMFGIDPDQAELTEGTIELPIKSAIDQMITISHNYSALLLTNKIGESQIADFLTRYGFSESSLGNPLKTTPLDLALFFEKLYKGEIIDAEYSKRMLDILSKQQVSDRIPKFLPTGTRIAHKTGDIEYFENDAGIVFTDKGDYIIVVLTETDSPQDVADKIAQISKAAYDYFTR